MGKQRADGSIQSSNTPDVAFSKQNAVKDFGVYRCMITKVFYIDDPENTTFQNREVTYNAVILGGPKEGLELSNIKSSSSLGGQYNYEEVIWRPIDPKSKGMAKKPLSEQEGDIVLIQFLQGDPTLPVIVGGMVQVLDLTATGATKNDGPIKKVQYNGVFNLINKNGEYTLIRKGGKYDPVKNIFTPNDNILNFEAFFNLTDNLIELKDSFSGIIFNKQNQTTQTYAGVDAVQTIQDGKNEKLTHSFKSGMTIVIDGKNDRATITSNSGQELNVDGQTGKITLGSDFVDLGKAVSDFSVLFSELASAFNTHTHLYNPGPGGATPSSTPIAPLLATVASYSVKLQP